MILLFVAASCAATVFSFTFAVDNGHTAKAAVCPLFVSRAVSSTLAVLKRKPGDGVPALFMQTSDKSLFFCCQHSDNGIH